MPRSRLGGWPRLPAAFSLRKRYLAEHRKFEKRYRIEHTHNQGELQCLYCLAQRETVFILQCIVVLGENYHCQRRENRGVRRATASQKA